MIESKSVTYSVCFFFLMYNSNILEKTVIVYLTDWVLEGEKKKTEKEIDGMKESWKEPPLGFSFRFYFPEAFLLL